MYCSPSLIFIFLIKVQEWFKNRRKKDKLLQSRVNCPGTPKGKRGRKLMLPHIVKTPPTTSLLTLATSPSTHVQEQVSTSLTLAISYWKELINI